MASSDATILYIGVRRLALAGADGAGDELGLLTRCRRGANAHLGAPWRDRRSVYAPTKLDSLSKKGVFLLVPRVATRPARCWRSRKHSQHSCQLLEQAPHHFGVPATDLQGGFEGRLNGMVHLHLCTEGYSMMTRIALMCLCCSAISTNARERKMSCCMGIQAISTCAVCFSLLSIKMKPEEFWCIFKLKQALPGSLH